MGEVRFDGEVAVVDGKVTDRSLEGVERQLTQREATRHWAAIIRGAHVVMNELRWAGMEVGQYRATPAFEFDYAHRTRHTLTLYTRPPDRLSAQFGGLTRHTPPSAGSIILVPAGIPLRARSSGFKDVLDVNLEPEVVERVAAEAFELDPARVSIPPLYGLQHPQLRATLWAIREELAVEGGGDRLAIESLRNLLAVHVLRHASALPPSARRVEGALPRAKLRAVLEFVEEHLDTQLSLAQMAKAVHTSAYHFARQFKAAMGTSPHRYVVARRVERVQQLLRESGDVLSLAELAAEVGFSDQSQLSTHFKRVVGVTPSQFRKSLRVA